ncbi:hypothetical protein K1719_025463 [Acacia pycnantha]|nr:hypothetical protein K1719_025463 [Acacia pycnantha]
MGDDMANVAPTAPKIPSFKDKLLNSDSNPSREDEDDITLPQGDVSIGLNRKIPTVDFASHVIDTLNKKMGLTVVVKLLGRKIGYCHLRMHLQSLWKPSGQFKLIDLHKDCFLVRLQDDLDYQNAFLTGPWMIFGHYLTVHPWMPSFRPQDHVVNQVIGWIRLPKLPARYYHRSIIRSIGGVFGDVIRVDYNTDSGDRGKFARIVVVLDLTKPLISKIQDSCSAKMVPVSESPAKAASSLEPNVLLSPEAREMSHFGAWMQVQRRRRPPARGNKANVVSHSKKEVNGSHYEVLGDALEEERPGMIHSTKGSHHQNDEPAIRKTKAKETKSSKKVDTRAKHNVADLQRINCDSLPSSRQISGAKADSIIKKLGFHNSHKVEASGFSRGIWILWSSNVTINILVNHVQFVHMEISWACLKLKLLFTAVFQRHPAPQ